MFHIKLVGLKNKVLESTVLLKVIVAKYLTSMLWPVKCIRSLMCHAGLSEFQCLPNTINVWFVVCYANYLQATATIHE